MTDCAERMSATGGSLLNKVSVRARVNGNRIDYEYDVSGPWQEAFNGPKAKGWFIQMNGGEFRFFAEYDVDLTGIPQSLAVLPFLANVLPMAWFYDAEVHIEEVDRDFYECLPAVKSGMMNRHPPAQLGGKLVVDRLISNQIEKSDRAISLFSGGVDATFTAVSNLASKPILTTVWGADIYLRQKTEWAEVAKQNAGTAADFGLDFASIKSTFRSFLNYEVLKRNFDTPLKMPSWWYSVQHSIALVALVAPLAWAHKANCIFIASSYSVEDDPETKCCNWPDIDGNVRYAGLSVTHHDFNFTRQQKVSEICKFYAQHQRPMNLRVCWSAVSATNCCACEKCARTIYAIIAEGQDPNNFGFACTPEVYANLEMRVRSNEVRVSPFWDAVAQRVYENVPNWRDVPYISAMMEAHGRVKAKQNTMAVSRVQTH